MIRVIRLDRINELLEEYNQMKDADEGFDEFIRVSSCEDGDCRIFDWEEVDENDLKKVREKL